MVDRKSTARASSSRTEDVRFRTTRSSLSPLDRIGQETEAPGLGQGPVRDDVGHAHAPVGGGQAERAPGLLGDVQVDVDTAVVDVVHGDLVVWVHTSLPTVHERVAGQEPPMSWPTSGSRGRPWPALNLGGLENRVVVIVATEVSLNVQGSGRRWPAVAVLSVVEVEEEGMSRDLADPSRIIWHERDVAYFFGCSCRTVRRWRQVGALPFLKLPGGRIVYSSAEILEHVQQWRRSR
jgi:hypothetical protein